MALISVSNNALQNITAVPASVPSGALVLLSTQTASASASISFTSGIDSTYDSYVFKFINIHPSALSSTFQFNLSTDGGSNYNVTKTTTFFRPTHKEDGTDGGITYRTPSDLAQSTAFQGLTQGLGNGVTISNDASASGILTLFNPSSTTYVKHFIAEVQHMHNNDYSMDTFVAGYGNTTSAVNAVRFQMSSGNIDDGIIKLYGVK
jgi:hypothetical protein